MWNEIAREVAHRPWPLPERPFFMTMSWLDLLFAHWRAPAELLREQLPEGLELDLHDGDAWVGVVPFRMENVGPVGLNWLPWVSAFPEINVRTYVTKGGKPGVWFLSLDATNRIAIAAARAGFSLPYFRARVELSDDGDWVRFASHRDDRRLRAGSFGARYRPTSDPYAARAATLEYWLTERYCLYAADRHGKILRGDIHHTPWPLQRAELEIDVNTVADAHGLSLVEPPELLHFSRRLDVVAWLPQGCAS